MLHRLSVSDIIHLNVLSTEFNYGTKYSVKHKTATLYCNNRAARSIPQLHSTLLSQKWSQGLYLIPGSELMNGKDLCRIQRLAEDVNGSELPTEHPVSICSLWRAQETFIITLQEGREEEEIIKKQEERYKKISFLSVRHLESFQKRLSGVVYFLSSDHLVLNYFS